MSVQEAQHTQHAINTGSYQELGLPEVNSGHWEIMNRFLSRPWFFCVWVIQEAVLSTSVEVICGAWSTNWRYILRALMRAIILGAHMALDRAEAGAFAGSPANPLISAIQLNALGAGESDFVRWECIDLLHRGRISIASRPQDYCYGLLDCQRSSKTPISRWIIHSQ
jgi:hypothetical protein